MESTLFTCADQRLFSSVFPSQQISISHNQPTKNHTSCHFRAATTKNLKYLLQLELNLPGVWWTFPSLHHQLGSVRLDPLTDFRSGLCSSKCRSGFPSLPHQLGSVRLDPLTDFRSGLCSSKCRSPTAGRDL
jgi:hypothetical protein